MLSWNSRFVRYAPPIGYNEMSDAINRMSCYRNNHLVTLAVHAWQLAGQHMRYLKTLRNPYGFGILADFGKVWVVTWINQLDGAWVSIGIAIGTNERCWNLSFLNDP